MIKDISEITFIKKGAFNKADYFQIEILEDKNLLKFIDNRYYSTMNDPVIKNISDEIVMDFLDKLFRIVDSWNEKYINNNTFDGTKWQLVIKFRDGHSRQYYGKDSYPNNFEALENLKYNIIESNIGK